MVVLVPRAAAAGVLLAAPQLVSRVGLVVVLWQIPALVSLAVQGGMQVFQPLLGMEASVRLIQLLLL